MISNPAAFGKTIWPKIKCYGWIVIVNKLEVKHDYPLNPIKKAKYSVSFNLS